MHALRPANRFVAALACAALLAPCAAGASAAPAAVDLAVSSDGSAASDVVVADAAAYETVLPAVDFNGVHFADVAMLLRKGNEYYARASDLVSWKIRVPNVSKIVYDGERFVPLASLMATDVRFDPAKQTFVASIAPGYFLKSDVAFLQGESRVDALPMEPTGGGLFTDYSFVGALGSAGTSFANLTLQSGAFLRHGEFRNGFTADSNGRPRLARLDTDFVSDRASNLTSLRLGDSYAKNDIFGSPVRFGGVQFGTDFTVDPRFVSFPTAAIRGTAYVPSVVDVYVDGALAASQPVQPGDFTLRNLNVSGAGTARVVVRDQTGRTQTISQDFVSTPLLLKAHLSEYSVAAGFARVDAGNPNDHYGSFIASANERYGVNDRLTVGGHAEIGGGGGVASFDVLTGIPQIGVVGLGLSKSVGRDGAGSAFDGSYAVTRGPVSASVAARYRTKTYEQVGDRISTLADRPLGLDLLAAATLRLGRGMRFTLSEADSTLTLAGAQRVTAASLSVVSRAATYDVRLDRTRTLGFASNGVYASVAFQFAGRRQLRAATDMKSGSTATTLTYDDRRAQNHAGDDVETSLRKTDGTANELSFLVRSPRERADFRYGVDISQRYAVAEGEIVGSIVSGGGATTAATTLGDGQVLIKTAIPNVGVSVDGTPIGRTDRHGAIATSQYAAGLDNVVRLDPNDMPSALTAVTTRHFRPARRGLTIIDMSDITAGAISIHLFDADDRPVPPGFEAIASNGTHFPVGHGGLVYIAPARPGSSELTVRLPYGETCRASFVVPHDVADSPDLGKILCVKVDRVSIAREAGTRGTR